MADGSNHPVTCSIGQWFESLANGTIYSGSGQIAIHMALYASKLTRISKTYHSILMIRIWSLA